MGENCIKHIFIWYIYVVSPKNEVQPNMLRHAEKLPEIDGNFKKGWPKWHLTGNMKIELTKSHSQIYSIYLVTKFDPTHALVVAIKLLTS